jgi:hypothetical protein
LKFSLEHFKEIRMCNFASMSIVPLFLDLSKLLAGSPKSTGMWSTDLLKFWLQHSIVLRLEDEAR